MKIKYGLTNSFIQAIICILTSFILLTQIGGIRQPTRLFIQIILVLSLISFIINMRNYFKEEKD